MHDQKWKGERIKKSLKALTFINQEIQAFNLF
jgi:hypothetical protein